MAHDDSSENKNVDALAASLAAATIENPSPSPSNTEPTNLPQGSTASPHPSRVYTRAQLLSLHNSPLVKPPPDMPDLKTWFGVENEQSLSKKDADPSNTGGTRDRRFRRDYEDGETPARTSFRTTVTQPSQMGNFKHQSLRERDKERDRDGDKDRERDNRDKEGQERLRHLSDKYDRDRIASATRNKDRDGAPHLNSTGSRTSQATGTVPSSRRNEPRDGAKRKAAETGDDWRRGGNDPSRSTRDERSETGRREREERDNGRSRPRDSSRPRPEASRRDRDDGRTRDREDSRRDRERDEDEDARHWRDDGKRDERIAARRARERQGDHWEPSNDRRWPPNEDRDGRYKRTNGRERRGQDELKERDDRKDRDKEKEPAWMDTYVPSEPLPGILGGKSAEGELDGIQAWKKGLKEKETQDKDKGKVSIVDVKLEETKAETPSTGTNEGQMDEIQLFRLMMQKEKDKRESDNPQDISHPILHLIGDTGGTSVKSTSIESDQVERSASASMGNREQENGAKVSGTADIQVSQPPPANDAPHLYSQESRLPQLGSHLTSVPANGNVPSDGLFVPPAGSRLLALGRGPKPPQAQNPPLQAPAPKDANTFPIPGPTRNQPSRGGVGFSPFEEAAAHLQPGHVHLNTINHLESQQRLQPERPSSNSHYSSGTPDNSMADLNSNGYNAAKGSRFAKFFDGKTRDGSSAKSQSPVGFGSSSPIPGQRLDQGSYGPPAGNQDERRTFDELFAMLSNSQAHSNIQNPNLAGGLANLQQGSGGFNGHPSLQAIQHPHHQSANRVESLYDSRLDDRSFVPNDMVPGLRTFPPPRTREAYPDDDAILHLQRLSQQQHQHQLHHRNEPSFSGPLNPLFNQQPHRTLPVQQQPQFRSNVSPGSHQLLQQNPQRFPPGLANLGNRPPHSDPSQFIGLPGGNQLPNLPNNSPIPQQFNNFNNNNNMQFNGPPFRGGLPPINLHQGGSHVPLNLAQNDPRLSNQHFNPGVGGGIGLGGQRLPNNGMGVQQRPAPHLQAAQLGLRPQQSGVPHHLLPHMHPSNVPPQHPTNQPAQDLMALLMGGTLRE